MVQISPAAQCLGCFMQPGQGLQSLFTLPWLASANPAIVATAAKIKRGKIDICVKAGAFLRVRRARSRCHLYGSKFRDSARRTISSISAIHTSRWQWTIEFHPDDDSNHSKAMKVHARIFCGITATTGVRRVPLQPFDANCLNERACARVQMWGFVGAC